MSRRSLVRPQRRRRRDRAAQNESPRARQITEPRTTRTARAARSRCAASSTGRAVPAQRRRRHRLARPSRHALSAVSDVIHRARELARPGRQPTRCSRPRRDAIADEIDQLSRHEGGGERQLRRPLRLLPGAANDTRARTTLGGPPTRLPPDDATGAVSCARSARASDRRSTTGDACSARAGRDGELDTAARHRRRTCAPAHAARRAARPDLKALDASLDAAQRRARRRRAQNRLDTARSRLADIEARRLELLSKTEDADIAETIIDFSTQQAVYQAALNAGARIVQPRCSTSSTSACETTMTQTIKSTRFGDVEIADGRRRSSSPTASSA